MTVEDNIMFLNYEGEMKNGKPDGNGTMIYKNGDKYEGAWVKGQMEGIGTMLYINGNKYEGAWVKGQMEGNGTMLYINGNKYEGQWVKGKREGTGKLSYSKDNERGREMFYGQLFCKMTKHNLVQFNTEVYYQKCSYLYQFNVYTLFN